MKEIRHCPEHGSPESEDTAWGNCPVAVHGDPLDKKTCPHFDQELTRIYREVTEHGNYFRLSDGMKQEYRNHQPYGDPKPL